MEIAKSDPVAAADFVEDLGRQVDKLVALGVTGVPRDEISAGLRAFPYRKRCFYFRVTEESFTLLRVLHGAQHAEAHLSEEH